MTRAFFLHRLCAGALVVLLLPMAAPAHAQNQSSASSLYTSPEGCVEQIRDRLRQQRRLWQGVLYGEKPARELLLGTMRNDEDGIPWIKTQENRWRTAAKGLENTELSDAQLDERTEWTGMNELDPKGTREKRLGIFERKGAVTPELVPDIVAGYRDFECRTEMVCESANLSLSRGKTDANGFLHVTTPGCEELIARPLERCAFGEQYVKGQIEYIDAEDEETAPYTQCTSLARDMVEREAAFVKISVSYDAAYRSLLQFAGAFDGFLRALHGDLLGPIENTLPLLNALTRASCFAGSFCGPLQ